MFLVKNRRLSEAVVNGCLDEEAILRREAVRVAAIAIADVFKGTLILAMRLLQ